MASSMTAEHALTFLFTDIEGSTRLWERYPATMNAVIARHERILRDAIRHHGGSVFNTAGDSVCAVFDAPDQAVAAAIEGQRGLQIEPWEVFEPGLRISVRMALDTGEVYAAGGNYLGPALNQLHRLMSTGHGGQILCGSAVAEAIDGGSNFALRYLGSHGLRDVAGDVRIFQVDAPGLPRAFPRLIVDRRPSTRLPYHPAALIGRDADLDRIGAELRNRTARVVTLLGPGGVGKTTLAVALARRLDDAFPDGVHFIDLSAVQDGDQVVPAIVRTLEIEDPLLGPEDALISGLRHRELLLVLDNCEQVVEDVARFVARLVQETEHISALATSRIPLRIAVEREERIEPFPLPDESGQADENPAVQLFSEHARQVNARFSLNAVAMPAVVDICRMIDGLPLAIELAAAWVRILDPATLRNRLADGAPLLRSDARDRPERHRTLASTIDWSFQLLDPVARGAFGRLSVFKGGIPLDGALAVLQGGGRATIIEALEQLDLLVQVNLLQPPVQSPDGPRYHMLQTIQEFALGTLSSDERIAASRAHAGYFASMAASAEEHYRGPEAAIWLDRLDANVADLRHAVLWLASAEGGESESSLRLATQLWEYVDSRGRQYEFRGLLSQALDAAPHAPAVLRGRALALLGNAWHDNYEQSETYYRRSLEVVADGEGWQMAATLGLGHIALQRRDYDRALAIAGDVLQRSRDSLHPAAVAQALLNQAHVLDHAGRSSEAFEPLEESRRISAEIGDIAGVAWVSLIEARAHESLGNDERAELLLKQAIDAFRTVDERISVSHCKLILTRVLLTRKPSEAHDALLAAVDDLLLAADAYTAAEAIETGAQLLIRLDDPEDALDLLGAATAWRRASGTQLGSTSAAAVEGARSVAMQRLGAVAARAAFDRGASRSLRDALLFLQARLQMRQSLPADSLAQTTIV